jgi:hypothetical protein
MSWAALVRRHGKQSLAWAVAAEGAICPMFRTLRPCYACAPREPVRPRDPAGDRVPVSAAPGRQGRWRWVIATLLLLATTINYVDRQTISVAAPVISRELGFSARTTPGSSSSRWPTRRAGRAGGLIDRSARGRLQPGDRAGRRQHAARPAHVASCLFRFLLGPEAGNYPAALWPPPRALRRTHHWPWDLNGPGRACWRRRQPPR